MTITTTSSVATCGRMIDVDCAVGDTPCLTAADDSGYEIDEAEVIYWGRCPECVAATSHRNETSEEKDRRVSDSENPAIASPDSEADPTPCRTRTGGRIS